MMKPEALFSALEDGRLAPVYFFSGDNEFLKEEAVDRIIARAVEPGAEAFSLDILNGGETDAATILTLAATVPMLSPRRVVVVRAFQQLSQGDREAVIRYAEQPNPTTTLVLITPRIDLKTKWCARLAKVSAAVVFYPLYPERIPSWLQQRAKRLKKRITVEACQALHGIVGDDLRELAGELDKAAAYVGNRETIDAADIEALMGPARASTVFDLAHAVGEKDLARAYRMLAAALDLGEAPHAIVAVLVRHLSILWKIRLLKHDRQTDEAIKKRLRLGWGFNRRFSAYVAQARLLADQGPAAGFEALFQADLALKTSARPHRLIMQELVYALCRGSGERAARTA